MAFNLSLSTRMYIGVTVGCLALILLVYRLLGDVPAYIGSIGLLLYLGATIAMVTTTLYRVFFLQLRKVSTWVLGTLTVLASLGVSMAIPIIYYRLDTLVMTIMLIVHMLVWFLLFRASYRLREAPHEVAREQIPSWHAGEVLSGHYLWVVLYVLVWCGGMMSLIGRATGDVLVTPWHVLPTVYIWLVAIGGGLLILLLFSRTKTSLIMCVIVMQSVLMHMYIPASSPLPAGGDIWRHIGRVNHIVDGGTIGPSLVGEEARMVAVGPIVIPEIFTAPQQYAYSMQWGIMSLWYQVTAGDLLSFSRWFLPFVWAIGVPVIFFYIGYLLFRAARPSLFFASLTLIPFSFQALGSLYLPVTFGYVVFFLALLWLFFALRYGTQVQWMLVLLSSLVLLMTYPLHAILYIWVSLIGWYLFTRRGNIYNKERRIVVWIAVGIGMVLLPMVEFLAGYSTFGSPGASVVSLTRAVGEHSGWYIASAIRPHDILSGNILFNHTPADAFVTHMFTAFRWHLLGLATMLYGLAMYGWVTVLTTERRTSWQLLAVLGATVWGGYLIGWYVLGGERQLVRRLDVLFAALLLVFGWYAIIRLIDAHTHMVTSRRRVTILLLLGSLFVWWGGMTAFTLGPDMRSMSMREYTLGRSLADTQTSCVLADTWPLLAAEAYSSSRLIGGGFPMDTHYGQPARTSLYEQARNAPSGELLSAIASVVDTDTCLLALPFDDTTLRDAYVSAYGQPNIVSGYGVWELELQKTTSSTSIE